MHTTARKTLAALLALAGGLLPGIAQASEGKSWRSDLKFWERKSEPTSSSEKPSEEKREWGEARDPIKVKAEALTSEWAKTYNLSEWDARAQLRDTEEGLRKGEDAYGSRVPEPTAFRAELVGIPSGSSRKAIMLRSNQPSPENLAELAAAGRKVGIAPSEILVINLRIENNLEERYVASAATHEDPTVREMAGVRTKHLPLIDHTIPTVAEVNQVLDAARDPANKLVVIHCAAGRARTGVMMAAVRIALDGWSVDRALEEAKSMGMNRLLQVRFVRRFAESLHSSQSLNEPKSTSPSAT